MFLYGIIGYSTVYSATDLRSGTKKTEKII